MKSVLSGIWTRVVVSISYDDNRYTTGSLDNRNGIRYWTMFHADNEKEEKETMKGIKRPNQENIRTLRKKENGKCLGILEAGSIKQMKIKEKVRKNNGGSTKNFSKTNSQKSHQK